MTLDLVPAADPTSETLAVVAPALDLARSLAKTEFVPKTLRNRPEAVMAAILAGRELAVGPMQALRSIYVVEGTPTLSAALIRALILRAGHELWTSETTVTRCVLNGIRRGEDRVRTATFTITDAERAKVAGKDVWRRYPRRMLLARATSELASDAFPDVTLGLHVLEDFDVVDVEEGTAGEVEEGKPSTRRRSPRKTAPKTPPPSPGPSSSSPANVDPPGIPEGPPKPPVPGRPTADDPEVVDAELVDETPEETPKRDTTPAQRLRLYALRNGIDDDLRHAITRIVLPASTGHAGDLDDDGLAIVRTVLDDLIAGVVTVTYDANGNVVLDRPDPDAEPAPEGDPVPPDPAGWKARADALGTTPAAVLLAARRAAAKIGTVPPKDLDELAADPDLGTAVLEELDPPF